jgi:hypothetical protein
MRFVKSIFYQLAPSYDLLNRVLSLGRDVSCSAARRLSEDDGRRWFHRGDVLASDAWDRRCLCGKALLSKKMARSNRRSYLEHGSDMKGTEGGNSEEATERLASSHRSGLV